MALADAELFRISRTVRWRGNGETAGSVMGPGLLRMFPSKFRPLTLIQGGMTVSTHSESQGLMTMPRERSIMPS